jgi:hypothetical protein
MVLLWDKKNEKSGDQSKFNSLWLGPYHVDFTVGHNTFQLVDLDGDLMGISINGQCLKYFFNNGPSPNNFGFWGAIILIPFSFPYYYFNTSFLLIFISF